MTELCAPTPEERGPATPTPLPWTVGASLSVHLLLLVLLYIFRPVFTLQEPSSSQAGIAVVFANDLDNPGQSTEATPAPQSSEPRVNLSPDDMQEEESAPVAPSPIPMPPPRPHLAPHKLAHNANPFANMPIYALGPPTPRPLQSRGQPTAAGMDLAMGPIAKNGQELDPSLHFSSNTVSSDWGAGLNKWIDDHAYYPQEAIERREEGVTIIQAVILRDGTVKSVRKLSSSGSRWIDLATQSIFQGQKVPAFPPDMPDKEIVVTLDAHYNIIRTDAFR